MFVTPGSRTARSRPSPYFWEGTPGGRLTLTTGTPVLIANTTAQSTIYYALYNHNKIPIFDPIGNDFLTYAFTELSLALDSNAANTGYHQSGKNFDVFAWLRGGKVVLGTGPAWSSDTARASAIARVNGVWLNSVNLTLKYDTTANTITLAANRGTYLGTFRATANGQTGMSFTASGAGGGANVLGVFNAYNRIPLVARSLDTTVSWTYSSSTWRAANGNSNNSISYMDGLGEVPIQANYGVGIDCASAKIGVIGVGRDSTSGTPAWQSANYAAGGVGQDDFAVVLDVFVPSLGYHTVYAQEVGDGTNVATYYGSGFGTPTTQTQALLLHLEL